MVLYPFPFIEINAGTLIYSTRLSIHVGVFCGLKETWIDVVSCICLPSPCYWLQFVSMLYRKTAIVGPKAHSVVDSTVLCAWLVSDSGLVADGAVACCLCVIESRIGITLHPLGLQDFSLSVTGVALVLLCLVLSTLPDIHLIRTSCRSCCCEC